jgi:hypothetical protein
VDPAKLMPAVAHATEIVKLIGERFLWADCLCIMQNDPARKLPEIQAMDEIYSNAALTIVAAAPVNAGLPGVCDKRNSHQHIGHVRGLTLVSGMQDIQFALSTSRWNARAWTYQEDILSKRNLIFTPFEMFYVCSSDVMAETCLSNLCIRGQYSSPSLNFRGHTISPALAQRLIDRPASLVSYTSLVDELSTREMSHDSDALNVGAGILNMLERETGMPFICGLPAVSLFEHYIFWLPRLTLERRGASTIGYLFPSWSWISWKGKILDTVVLISGSNRSAVSNCDVLILSEKGQSHDFAYNQRVYRRVPLLAPDVRHLDRMLLQCSASMASVPRSRFARGSLMHCMPENLSVGHALFVDNICAGLVVFNRYGDLPQEMDLRSYTQPQAWIKSRTDTRDVQLIGLSVTSQPWSWSLYYGFEDMDEHDLFYHVTPWWSEPEEPETDAGSEARRDDGVNAEDSLPYDNSHWRRDADLVNVMLVDFNNGVAVREGIGQIHIDAWNLVKQPERMIILG